MASSSASSSGDMLARVKDALRYFSSDTQLLGEIRKAINSTQQVAVQWEKLNRTDEVKKLEDTVKVLLYAAEECKTYSDVLQLVGDIYLPGAQKLSDVEKSKIKLAINLQKDPLLRRFREAIWNVHHQGQPLPGDENEDIVMTTTQCLLNTVCPITGKAVTDLAEPVRSMDCKHVYEKEAILLHIKYNTKSNKCPVAGCPKTLHARRVVCDPLLSVEIEEMRSQNRQTDGAGVSTFSDDDSM